MFHLFSFNRPILALIIANFIWGAAAPIYKYVMAEGTLDPMTLAFSRFSLATLILLPFVIKQLKIQKKDFVYVFFIGLTLSIHIGLLNIALVYTSSINAPIIGTAAPLFLIPLSFFLLKEPFKIRKVVGCIIGFIGVLVILLLPLIAKGLDGTIGGNLLLIASTFGAVAHTILTKEVIGRYKPIVLVWWTFFLSTIFFTPFMLLSHPPVLEKGFLAIDIFGIVYAGVFASVVCYLLYYYAVKNLEVSDVAMFAYLDPVVTVLVAVPLLGEIPTIEYLLGAFLVFLGIYVAERRIHYHPLHLLKTK